MDKGLHPDQACAEGNQKGLDKQATIRFCHQDHMILRDVKCYLTLTITHAQEVTRPRCTKLETENI